MAHTDTLPPPPPHQIDPDRASPAFRPLGEDVHLSGEIKEKGVFASLISSFRDVFFPLDLPPLVLESKAIAVPDRMAVKRSPTSTAVAVIAHILVILLIAFFIAREVHLAPVAKANVVTLLAPPPPPPPIVPKVVSIGGGGGQHELAPVTRGRIPKVAQVQIVPPEAPPTIAPKISLPPTVVVQKNLQMATNAMPNLGMPNSPLKGISLGNGAGTGIGAGSGAGVGPGSGGNMGGGLYHIGGGITKPVVIYSVEPEFSEEARKAKFSGNVEVYLWVDENGNPSHIRVVRGVGMGLDEKAIEAVRQFKFKPAMKDGKPVKVDLYFDVNFQIF